MRNFLKIAPLAFLVVLCFAPLINAPALAPQSAAPNHQLRSLLSTRTVGPPPSWNKTYGGTIKEELHGVALCSDGGFVMVGETSSYGEGSWDVYLVRTNADGNMLWNKTYGGTQADYGSDVVVLSDGFLIAGRSNSFGASLDLWLIRTDLNGNHLWNVSYGDPSDDEYACAVVADASGGFAIGGMRYDYSPLDWSFWLVHTDASGGNIWNQTYNSGQHDYLEDMVECTGGGFALCGHTEYNTPWLVRTNAAGNHLWNQTYGAGDEMFNSIVECSSGGFALAGETYSPPYDAWGAAWLCRTDGDGNHLWNQTYSCVQTDQAQAVIEYSQGGFALAGFTNYSYSDNGDMDALLLCTDSDGNMLWNSTYDHPTQDIQYMDVVECSNGDLVTAGFNSLSGQELDFWLAKTRNPLAFTPALTDQTLAYGDPLAYDINVHAYFGEDTFSINDTTNFAISTAGIVSNATALASGVYGIQVTVNDTIGYEISGEFNVTVEAPITPPPIPGFPIEAIALGLAIATGLSVITRRRRRKP